MTHDEALELAGLYALDALTPDEKAAVDAHIAACAEDHSEIGALGGVAPALAAVVEPIPAPPALKESVLAAYRAEMASAALAAPKPAAVVAPVARPVERPLAAPAPAARRWQAPNWLGWAAAGVAVVLLAVLSVYGLNVRQQADQANQRAEQIAAAVAAMSEPGSQVAILHGTGAAAGANGFAAFPASGGGYVVMTDVPAAPNGMTYQAWYIVDGKPSSAGLMTVGPDGNLVASGMQPAPGTQVVAVTLEPAGGSDQPTSQPIIVGNVTTPT
jgi:anti-sigma-K factor RskA